MLSAINWNACPQSIGIAVRDRWNAAINEDRTQCERSGEHGESAWMKPRSPLQEGNDGEGDGECRDKSRGRHQPIQAKAIVPPAKPPPERRASEKTKGET